MKINRQKEMEAITNDVMGVIEALRKRDEKRFRTRIHDLRLKVDELDDEISAISKAEAALSPKAEQI